MGPFVTQVDTKINNNAFSKSTVINSFQFTASFISTDAFYLVVFDETLDLNSLKKLLLHLHTSISVLHRVKFTLSHPQNPSFHVSLAWCVGDMMGEMSTCVKELQVRKHFCSEFGNVTAAFCDASSDTRSPSLVSGCCRKSLKTKRKKHSC